MQRSPASGSIATTRRAVGPVWRLVFALLLAVVVTGPLVQPAWADDHAGDQPEDGASDDARDRGPVTVSIERADSEAAAVAGGEPVSYTVGLGNSGTTDLTDLTLGYEVPAGVTVAGVDAPGPWTCVLPSGAEAADGSLHCELESLEPGQQAPQIAMDLAVGEDAGDEIDNVVVAQGDGTEPVEAHESTPVQREAELSVTKADDVEDTVGFGGESFSWTIVVSNAGPSAARNVTLLDDLPSSVTVTGVSVTEPWTCVLPAEGEADGSLFCTLEALGAGESAPEVAITVAVDEDFSGEIRNVAVVDSDDTGAVEDAEATTVDVETVVAGVVLEKPSPSSPAPAEASTADATAQVASEELAATGVAQQLVPWVVLLLGLGAGLLLLSGRLSEQR